jgi:hypothetical protein
MSGKFEALISIQIPNPNAPMTKTTAASAIIQAVILFGSLWLIGIFAIRNLFRISDFDIRI